MSQHLAAGLRLALLFWLAWGLGRLAARLLRLRVAATLDEAVLWTGLGLGLLPAATLALGAAGLYRPAGFAAFYLALGAAAVAATIDRSGALRASGRAWRLRPRDPAAAILAAAAVVLWLLAISPKVFYDTLVYHMAVPNLYLLRGGVEHLPNLFFANFPLHAEMLTLLALQLGGSPLAGAVNFGLATLAAAALAGIVRRHADAATGRTAAALFLLAPPVLISARFQTVEVLFALFFTLEFWCLERWHEGGEPGWAAAAGLFAGWCFSTKYAAGVFALLPLLVFFAAAARARTTRRSFLPDALLLAACAAVAALPWLVKNAVFTGNPVFPAFFSVLGGRGWSAAQDAVLLGDAGASWRLATSAADFVRLPLDLVLHPARFGAAAASAWFWPATVVALLALLRARRDRVVLGLGAFLAAYLLLWGATFWLARLLIPALGIGAALIALALHRLLAARPRVRGSLLAGLAMWTAAALWIDGPTRRSLAPSLGSIAPDDYLEQLIASHPAVRFVNEQLPLTARVLVVGESRVAHLRRDHVHGSALDPAPLTALVGTARDAAGVEAGLARAGITHLLVNNRELARIERQYPIAAMDPPLKVALAAFLNERCRPLLRTGDVFLFALPGS